MKPLLVPILIFVVNHWGFSQEISDLTFECLEDLRSGGKVIQPEIFDDSIKMSLKTYGPCNADFEVVVKEMEQDGDIIYVGFEIFDKLKKKEVS